MSGPMLDCPINRETVAVPDRARRDPDRSIREVLHAMQSPTNGSSAPDWPPLPSPLDPFLRQLLGFIDDRDGHVSHTVFLRERPDGGTWPAGFLEVILTSGRARNFLRTMRGTGQTRHHSLTETGRRWLSDAAESPTEPIR